MPIVQAAKAEPEVLPGENLAGNPRAIIGGNNPPPEEQVVLDFREAMFEKLPVWEKRIEDLKASADRAVIDSEEAAGKGGDLVKAIRAMNNAINEAHRGAKDPYLRATKAVDAAKNQCAAALDAAKAKIDGKLTNFLREQQAIAEKARREAEARAREEAERAAEAERARREAEQAGDIDAMEQIEAVAAPARVESKVEPIRSIDTGAAVAGRKEWQCQVEDHGIAVLEMLDDDKIKEAIEACAKRRMRAGLRNQPGVKCWEALVARTY